MQLRNITVALLCAALAASARAADAPGLEEVPEAAPPPPPRVQSGEPLEPEVTIRQKEEETVEEYRIGGQLYMVKITPRAGKSYYLLDSDGDGKLETRMSHLYSNFVVPSWVILSW
ncbi:MAG: DUF2782 domain-containing protein [Chromatiales bacterium]